MEGCPEHAPFWIEGNGVAEESGELGGCGGERGGGGGDLVTDMLANASGTAAGLVRGTNYKGIYPIIPLLMVTYMVEVAMSEKSIRYCAFREELCLCRPT